MNDHIEDQPLSKTKRKQQAHDLQKLGERLVKLPDAKLDQLILPENLRDAVREARRIKSWGAISRHMQYIGRLMRDLDPEPIRAKFDEWDNGSRAETAHLHQLEHWRDRLLGEEQAVTEFLAEYPGMDAQHLRNLIRNARKEKLENKPPRNFRELFRCIREAVEGGTKPSEENGHE
jgi:ribosome-associated protein